MKKIGKWTIGGLQGKVFRLCIMLVITAICGFALIGMIQLWTLGKMANDTGKDLADTVRDQSEESMIQMTEANMKSIAYQAAYNTDFELWELRNEALTLAAQVEDVFRNPDNYGRCELKLPQKVSDGEPHMQLLYSEAANPSEEDMIMAQKLANLESIMKAMIVENEYDTQDLIIALPCGISLDVDILSDWKFAEDGSIQYYEAQQRPWWKQAVESGKVVITYAVHSALLDVSEIEFGVPVYVDGQLVAVVESSIRLETFKRLVSKISYGKTGFSIIVSNDGSLVYSPVNKGGLKMDDMLSVNIFDGDNEELKSLIKEALNGRTGFSEITYEGKEYCVAYAPMETVFWTQLVFVEKNELLIPTEELLVQMDESSRRSLSQYESSFRQSSWLTIIVMTLLVINAVLVALMFSGKLTNPINLMTEKVKKLSGDDFSFEMDEVYRTGDEIELLAETFGELSDRTKKYIREIMDITAEKERIGAELAIATQIQADTLPKEFPLYPERKDFDVYAVMTPAKEVAGDFYDIFMIDDDHLCLVMADVSGKGIPAALFMMVSKIMLENRAVMGGDPGQILKDVNKRLAENNHQLMFVTVWLAIVTLSTGHVVEANAGHENPAIKRKGGTYELHETNHDLVVGALSSTRYRVTEFDLAPGDMIFAYTDGVTDATNKDGDRFDIKGMMESLCRHKEDGPQELLHHVREDVDAFAGEAEQFDDITMMAFSYMPEQ